MNLGFNADHAMLRDELRKLLARVERHPSSDPVGAEPADASMWQALAGAGWLGTGVPELHGGSGLDCASLCVLAEEAGRALAALPLVASACAFVHALRESPG